jgi:DNA primase catalytic core
MNSSYAQVIELIKKHANLSEIINQDVKLHRKGREWTGCCPFHEEKTPSFYVHNEKGLYYCFGCGAKGDVIEYLIQKRKLSFKESVEFMCLKTGVAFPQLSSQESTNDYFYQTKKKQLLELYKDASLWYHQQLYTKSGEKAQSYLNSRQFFSNTWKSFFLGYAPHNGLESFMNQKGYSNDLLLEAGLLHMREDGTFYDYFRNRLMFCIKKSSSNEVIAFGGRCLHNEKPKYLNSPNTLIFQKKHELYGLNQYQSSHPPIVVEGYLDVIRLHEKGYPYGVAPLGTSLTIEHLQKLWRIHPYPIICFDGDEAGIKAANRCAEMILSHLYPNQSAQFVFLPKGYDPDTFLIHHNLEEFDQLIKNPISLFDTIWQQHQENFNQSQGIEYVEFERRKLSKIFSVVPDKILEQDFQRSLSKKVSQEKNKKINTQQKNNPKKYERDNKNYFFNLENSSIPKILTNEDAKKPHDSLEEILLIILLKNPTLIEKVFDLLIRTTFKNSLNERLRHLIIDEHSDGIEYSDDTMITYWEKIKKKLDNDEQKKILNKIEHYENYKLNTISSLMLKNNISLDRIYEAWYNLWYKYSVEKEIEEELVTQIDELKNKMDLSVWEKIRLLKKNIK